MKRVLTVLSCLTVLAVLLSYHAASTPAPAVASGVPAPLFAADKCATCPELL